jgi:hypothetical protein
MAQAQRSANVGSLEAIAYSDSEIRVYWLKAASGTGYRVFRDGKAIADLPTSTTEYRDTGLQPNSAYTYSVQALEGGTPLPTTLSYIERTFPTLPQAKRKREAPTLDYDIVVAQASSSGVAAAYEASRRGMRVALLEPTLRVGGMPTNGLSSSDLRRDERESGFFSRFRRRVAELYGREGVKADGFRYEPRVSHQAMKSLLYENGSLTLYRRFRFRKTETTPPSQDTQRRRVVSILADEIDANEEPTGRQMRFTAPFFIDATDSGDLAADAGAPYRIGREPKTPEEPHAGVIYYDRKEKSPLPGSTGAGDRRIQSYSYLLTVKNYGAGADKTLPTPPNYHREEFDDPTLPTWRSTWAATSGALPNGKHELNQHPKGGDLQEINYRYPEGDYRERKRVDALYKGRVLRYLYYIQTVYGMKSLGLPDDEYRENGGFPPLLYVREGRRILGEQLPVEADITNAANILRPESIGIGDYPMDSHAVRTKTDNDTRHMGEGEWWLFHLTPVYSIPFGIIVPQKLDNVFVTTAVSSTHVSYGTFRMEPVRMAMGQAGGVAAYLGIKFKETNREVNVRQIQEEMLPRLSNPYGDPYLVLHFYPDLKPNHLNYAAIQYMAVRGFRPEGERFQAESPTLRKEWSRWLRLLAERRGETNALTRLAQLEGESPITRAEVALSLAKLLPAVKGEVAPLYSDTTDPELQAAATKLAQYGIKASLWDSWEAHTNDGKLLFRPNAPLSHADAIQTLAFLERIGGEWLYRDKPQDYQNGRKTASE